MKISAREFQESKNAFVIDIEGSVDSDSVEEFGDFVKSLIGDKGVSRIVINMENLEYINTAGLSVIGTSYNTCIENGGNLAVLNPDDQINELLDIVRFSRTIRIFNDEKDAVSFVCSD